jgi:hypothetical protein
MLSYHPNAGMFTTLKQNDAHNKLNRNNAIILNTRDPLYFQEVYFKTMEKLAQD